jgi:DNA-binding NtrC family response regulator
MNFRKLVERFEQEIIVKALEENQGMINRTAKNFGIPKKTLLRKIKKFSIDAKLIREKYKPIVVSSRDEILRTYSSE